MFFVSQLLVIFPLPLANGECCPFFTAYALLMDVCHFKKRRIDMKPKTQETANKIKQKEGPKIGKGPIEFERQAKNPAPLKWERDEDGEKEKDSAKRIQRPEVPGSGA